MTTSVPSNRWLAACMLAAAGLAQAQPYAGVSAGQSQLRIDCAGTTSCDDTGIGYKGFAGCAVNDNVAIEAAWYRQGKARFTATDAVLGDAHTEVRGDAIGLYGLFIAPYGHQVRLFGKLGIVGTRTRLDTHSSLAGNRSREERHANIGWGIGGEYDLTALLGVRLEYERTRMEFLSRKHDIDMVTAGLVWRF